MEALAAEYRRAVDERPNDPNARYSLALALMYNEHWAEAVPHLRRVVELMPKFADAYARLAVCLANLGELGEAWEAVADGLSMAPEHEELQRVRRELEGLSEVL
jgi:Flp pilus assembly protein TadD